MSGAKLDEMFCNDDEREDEETVMQYWKSHDQFNEMLWAFEQAFSCNHSKPSVVIGEDTDLLVILCFHGKMDECELYFYSEAKSKRKQQRIWDIKQTKNKLGFEACEILPVLHALSACDTTSQLFGVGKYPEAALE